jgi:hypothetical protein
VTDINQDDAGRRAKMKVCERRHSPAPTRREFS